MTGTYLTKCFYETEMFNGIEPFRDGNGKTNYSYIKRPLLDGSSVQPNKREEKFFVNCYPGMELKSGCMLLNRKDKDICDIWFQLDWKFVPGKIQNNLSTYISKVFITSRITNCFACYDRSSFEDSQEEEEDGEGFQDVIIPPPNFFGINSFVVVQKGNEMSIKKQSVDTQYTMDGTCHSSVSDKFYWVSDTCDILEKCLATKTKLELNCIEQLDKL